MIPPFDNYDDEQEALKDHQTHKPQEQNVETTQELPAVSKLREAFEVARNAIVDGSELAKQVADLKESVSQLRSSVSSLEGDLEYVRGRNKELDEQVMSVRQARDQAIAELSASRDRAEKAEKDRDNSYLVRTSLENDCNDLRERLDGVRKERDDAMAMALEYEGKLKEALAKLDKVHEMAEIVFGRPIDKTETPKPVPHYLVQPRDEETKQFRPFEEPKTYDSGSQGSF